MTTAAKTTTASAELRQLERKRETAHANVREAKKKVTE